MPNAKAVVRCDDSTLATVLRHDVGAGYKLRAYTLYPHQGIKLVLHALFPATFDSRLRVLPWLPVSIKQGLLTCMRAGAARREQKDNATVE